MTSSDLSKKVLNKFPTAACSLSEYKVGISVDLGKRKFRVIEINSCFEVYEERGCRLEETNVSKFVQDLLNGREE